MQARFLSRGLRFALLLGVVLVFGAGCDEDKGLKIKRLSRDKGVSGDSLIIYGSGFQTDGPRNVRVFFEHKRAEVLGIKGNEQIVVKIPGGIDTGKTVDLKILFEPGGELTYPDAFTYIESERSTVDDLVGGDKKDE